LNYRTVLVKDYQPNLRFRVYKIFRLFEIPFRTKSAYYAAVVRDAINSSDTILPEEKTQALIIAREMMGYNSLARPKK